MTTQPEALSLAEVFETYAVDHQPDGWPAIRQDVLNSASAELRRLHAENEALRAERNRNLDSIQVGNNIIQRIKDENEALRAALEQPGVEPSGYVSGPIIWKSERHHSEQVVKITQHRQPMYGFVHPIYAAPQPAQRAEADKLLRQALDALHRLFGWQTLADPDDHEYAKQTITAIRKHLSAASPPPPPPVYEDALF